MSGQRHLRAKPLARPVGDDYLELIEVERVRGPHHPLGLDSWTKGKGEHKLVARSLSSDYRHDVTAASRACCLNFPATTDSTLEQ